MKIKIFAIAAGVSAFAAASAFAEHHEGKGEDHAAMMDAKIEAHFAEVDADGSGNISRDEFLAYKAAKAEKEWEEHAAAAGDDGEVSLDEAKALMAAKHAEKKAMMEEHHGEMKEHHDKMKDGGEE